MIDIPLIKICGIKTPELAFSAAKAGANYLGIIFHPPSKRFIPTSLAKEIALATKENGAIPVAVFVDHTALEMETICQETNIQVVQLHGDNARQAHSLLPAEYQRIYVQPVFSDGSVASIASTYLNQCDPARDFLLFDRIEAGQGQSFAWQQLNANSFFRIGVAGGLNVNNVAAMLDILHPFLVDVSTGVENNEGEKDLSAIQSFIEAIHHYSRNQI